MSGPTFRNHGPKRMMSSVICQHGWPWPTLRIWELGEHECELGNYGWEHRGREIGGLQV